LPNSTHDDYELVSQQVAARTPGIGPVKAIIDTVQEPLHRSQARDDLVGRRRDEHRVPWARAPDPHLGGAELTGRFLAPAPAPQENSVDFADEPERERKPAAEPV
jgi:hypothetical protein